MHKEWLLETKRLSSPLAGAGLLGAFLIHAFVLANWLKAFARLMIVGSFAPLTRLLIVPSTRHRVLAPHHASLRALCDGHGVERQLTAAHTAPSELRLADHLETDLVEAILVKLLRPEWTQAVGVSAAMILFGRARVLMYGASLLRGI